MLPLTFLTPALSIITLYVLIIPHVPHGGVGLFYKICLSVIHRQDLSFDEAIVIELKYFSQCYNSLEFEHFLSNL